MSKYIPKRVDLSVVTLPNEIWKDVPNYNGDYKISNLGRIYSYVSCRLLSLKPHKTFGYVTCPLGERKNRPTFRVHRLVAEAFIPNPENKKEVNHINKNRSDNRVENLEWSSAWENTQHKMGYGGIWNSNQGRIAQSDYSVAKRKLQGFSNVIIPMLNQIVPFK